MQLISLDKLKKLAKKPVPESDGMDAGAHFFWKFYDVFIDFFDETGSVEDAYSRVKSKFLRQHCPPVEYIAEGSSRAAYALDGGLCIKAAMDKKGIAQNRAEAENLSREDSFDIFPRLYCEGDEDLAILVECVSPCSDDHAAKFAKEFYRALKLKPFQHEPDYPTAAAAELLQFAMEELPGDFEMIFEVIAEEVGKPDWIQLAKAIRWPKNPAQRILSKLAKYMLEHPDSVDPGDFASFNNWGFAVREGQVVPIVLDVGFSPEVRDEYY